jgi:hypothetical protein
MKELSGVKLATFGSRAAALLIDFLLASLLFLTVMAAVILAAKYIPAVRDWDAAHDVHVSLLGPWPDTRQAIDEITRNLITIVCPCGPASNGLWATARPHWSSVSASCNTSSIRTARPFTTA